MHSLDSTFDELRSLLSATDLLNPAKGDPFFYFVHDPAQSVTLKRKLRTWCAALKQDDRRWKPEVVSFADIVWQLIGEKDPWEEWLELEPFSDSAEVRRSVASFLIDNDLLVGAVRQLVNVQEPDRLLLLTDTAVLHPFFRVRALEGSLHNQVRTPTVLFYPGRRVGQFGLQFLGVYPEDGNYRSTLVGG